MHLIGHDIVEQALVVGDQDEAARRVAQRVDAVGHRAQRVDVEAGIGLVEDARRGSSIAICRISLRFFSPPEKPKLRSRLSSASVDAHDLGLGPQPLHELAGADFSLAAGAAQGVHGLAQEVHIGDAGDLDRVLHGQEHAGGRPLLGRPCRAGPGRRA